MMEIKTNNQKREILFGFMLSDKEKAEFDYLESVDDAQFFRYRGAVYEFGEFSAINPEREPCLSPLAGWHCYRSDSAFSGVVVRYTDDYESIIVGTYLS